MAIPYKQIRAVYDDRTIRVYQAYNNVKNFASREERLNAKASGTGILPVTSVRIQWDPDRDLHLQPLKYRAIQIGLSKEAIKLYVSEWIRSITEVTDLATQIHNLVDNQKLEEARKLLPKEKAYPLSQDLKEKIQAS